MNFIKSCYLPNAFESRGKIINDYHSHDFSKKNFRKINDGEKVFTFVIDSMLVDVDGQILENVKWFPTVYNQSKNSFIGTDGVEYQSTINGLKIYRFPNGRNETRYFSDLLHNCR